MAYDESYQLAWSPIYDYTDETIDLFNQNMLDSFAATKDINPVVAGNNMITINQQFSAPALKALGHTSDGTIQVDIVSIDLPQVTAYLKSIGVPDVYADAITSVSPGTFSSCSFPTINASVTNVYNIGAMDADVYSWDYGDGSTYVSDNCDDQLSVFTHTTTSGDKTINKIDNVCQVSFSNRNSIMSIPHDPGWTSTYEVADFFMGSYVIHTVAFEDRMIYALNNLFGFRHDEIFESIEDQEGEDTNISEMWLTYAITLQYADMYLPELADKLRDFYDGRIVLFEADGATIQYRDGNTMEVDMHPFTSVADPIDPENSSTGVPYIIPLQFINEMTLRERYIVKRYCLCFMTTILTRTKLKWYQTGIFRAITWAVAIILAAYSMPQMLIGLLIGEAIGHMNLDPMVAAIVGVVIAIATTDIAGAFESLSMNTFSTVANIVNKISTVYFAKEIEALQGEVKDIQEDMQATNEAMQEFNQHILYSPLDSMDTYYSTMYELQFEMYNEAFNMDNYFRLPPTLPR